MLEKNGTYRRKKLVDRLRQSQLIVLSTIFTSSIWLAPSAANAANQTIERVSLFASNGSVAEEDRRAPTVQSGFSVNGLSIVSVTKSNPTNTTTQWEWKLRNASGAAINDVRLTGFVDIDQGATENTFFNETAINGMLNAPTGHIAADRWEVGELGYWSDSLLSRSSNGNLQNTATVPSSGEDVALALSAATGKLELNQEITAWLIVGGDKTAGLQQRDLTSNTSQSIQFYLLKNAAPDNRFSVDYAVQQTVSKQQFNVGEEIKYQILLTNNGPATGSGATLTSSVPSQLSNVQWTCTSQGAAACTTASGSGNNLSVGTNIPVGPGNQISVTVTGIAAADGAVTHTTQVLPTNTDTADSNSANNSSVTQINIGSPLSQNADVSIQKTTSTPVVAIGEAVNFRIVATNHGPGVASQATVRDQVPTDIGSVSWTCTGSGGASCGMASGQGSDILVPASLPVGAAITIEVNGVLKQAASNVVNTASVSSNLPDPILTNNFSSATINESAGVIKSIPSTGWVALFLLSCFTLVMGGFWLKGSGNRGNTLRIWSAGIVMAMLLGAASDSHAIFVNGDFEAQNVSGWTKKFGLNPGLTGSSPFQVSDVRINSGGIEKVTVVDGKFDPRAPQLILPRQGNYSVKVNDEDNGAHLNEISQKGTIAESDRDPGDGKLHVRFSYAAVLEDPAHDPNTQPYFFVELKDLTKNETLYYDFAFANQPGRVFFTTVLNGSKWVSTPFIDVDLLVPDSSLGNQLQIRVVGADCSASGHGGYIYVDAFGSIKIPPQGACIHDLKARSKPGNVQLTWSDTGAAKYAIYRAEKIDGPFIRVGTTESRYSTWLDRTVVATKTYYYSIRALDIDDHEVCSSGEVVTVVPEHWSIGDPVNRPPQISSGPVLVGDIRAPYEYQVIAADPDGDALVYQLMYGPAGMSVDAAGKLTWQPSLTGDYRVNLQVSDAKGLLASQAFSIHVVDGNLPPKLTNLFPNKVPAGVTFTHQVLAQDPESGPLQYTAGGQAVGLAISESGVITWTNPQPGTYPITIQVTDQHGARDTQQVVVRVEGFPEFTSRPVVTATVGQTYNYPSLAKDKDGDPVTYSVISGPAGLVINSSTGVVTWPVPTTGTHAVALGAADPDGNIGKQTFSIRATTTANRAPVFTGTPITYIAYPTVYSYTASARDDDGDNLTWSLVQSPAGMKINDLNGQITWTFDDKVAGKFPVQVQVDDRRGGISQQVFEIQVPVYGNGAPTISSRPSSQIRAGQLYSYAVTAADPEREALIYSLTQGPSTATWNSNQLNWLTSSADVGVHALTIEVADQSGNKTEQSWQLEVLPASGNQPPVITSSPRVSAIAGAAYEYQVVATDRDGDALQYALATGPAGMTISVTGKIEWPVPAAFAGSEPVDIKVSDGKGGEVTQSYSIGVGIASNRPPLINSAPVVTATAGAAYKYQVSASDPDSDTLAYTLSTNEPGITIGATTGLVEWTVPTGVTGEVQVTVLVTDGKGGSASQTYVIGVGQPGNRSPRITSQPTVTAISGSIYAYAVKATDPDGDALVYSLVELPQGMTIDAATGVIAWSIPANVAGLVPVTIEVSDGRGANAVQGFSVSVSGSSNRAPSFSSQPVTSATAGTSYSYTARATDPDGDAINYALTTTPAGMTINTQTGVITWTPTLQQGGNQSVAIQATDAKGASTTQSFSVYVQLPTNNPPQITSAPVMRGAPSIPYQYQVTATDPERDTLTYSLPTAPAGMTISNTGLVSWTSPVQGAHTVEVKVEDTRGASVVQRYTLQVAANNSPVITSTPIPVATVGAPYSYQVVANDVDGDFLTYQMTGSPATLSISTAGLISGAPTSTGVHNIIVTVSDGQSSVTQTWTLRVNEPAASGPLQASITPTPKYLRNGETTTLQAFAEGGTGPYTVSSLTVNGTSVPVNSSLQATFTPTVIGKYVVKVTMRDSKGGTVTTEDWFSLIDPNDTTAPVALITAPGTSTDITVTDVFALSNIVGTASDTNLAEYLVMISPAGKNQWSKLNSGATSVTNNKLADINPQTIANGLYDIALIVRDISGNETSAKIGIAITGEQKTAPLQLTFTDMSFNIEGLPLTVRRTYDSLKRMQRMDFGYGWTVDYQDVWLQTNGVLGRSWVINQVGSGFNRKLCVVPQGSRVASVRLPDGKLEQFEMRASPECVPVLQGISAVGVEFTPKASNKSGSKLEALGYGELRIAGGDLFDMDMTETFNPSQYKLTLLDGTEYTLDKDFGIQQVKDRRGNTLQFTNNGISHSGGWALAFTRDAKGKITKITGPGSQMLNYAYDGAENLTSVTDQASAVSDFRYENTKVAHGLTSYTDPLGRLALKTTYDDAGRVLSQTDATGKAVTIGTDNNAKKQTIKDRNGNTTVYDFDDRGNVTQVVDAAGGVTKYTYDANDNEIEVIDPLGRKTTRTFDQYGNTTSETDPAGRVTKTSFNAEGNVTTMTDAAGNMTTNGYNPTGDLTSITDATGKAFGMGYSPTGSLSSMTDKMGNATRYTYAKINGTTLKQTETAPDGTVTTYAYDSAGNVASTTRAVVTVPGQPATTVVEKSTYDAKGNVVSRTNAAGQTTSYQYDAVGQLTQETDSQGRKTTHEYTARGEKSKTTSPDGRVESWVYDNNGNETQSCVGGLCTRAAYDALDRATKVTDPMGFAVETIYDAAGQVTSSKDARGNSTTFEYDAAGREIKQTNAAGFASSKEYDLAGNLLKQTDGAGNAFVNAYDSTNKRLNTTLATGAVTKFSYDANGVLLSETNPLGKAYQFAYDPLGTLKTVTDPLGKITGYTWNGQSQLLSQTDANGRTTKYGYDSTGHRVSRTLPDGKSEAMAYDSEGRLVTRTDFDGSQTVYAYDTGGKLVKTTRADGATLTNAYDSYGRINSQTDTAYGSVNMSLDGNGRVTRESWNQSTLGTGFYPSIDYRWDGNGNRVQISTSSHDIKASYNTLNQLENLTSPDGSVTQFAYDDAGNRIKVTRADGSTTSYQYNTANQLTGVAHKKADSTEIAAFTYTLNAAGQRTQVIERMVGVGSPATTVERTVTYHYDDASKLQSESIAQTAPSSFNSTISYQYDAVGNRKERKLSHSGQTTTYQYDANDRLTQSVDSLEGTTTYQWDTRGNLTQKTIAGEVTQYGWATDNRLTKVTTGTKTVEYGYDTSGRRIKRLVKDGANTTETKYQVDHQRAYSEIVVESTSVNGAAWNDTVTVHTPDGVGELISSTNNASPTQYFTDGLGSVRVAQSVTGSHVYSYDAFGIELSSNEGMPVNAAQADEVMHRYTGEYADQQTGLVYLRARDYDPKIGRFISMDEHPGSPKIPLTLNKYLYGNADPVNSIDPSGNMFISIAMPSFGNIWRMSSSLGNAVSFLGKLDAALTKMQMLHAVWSAVDHLNSGQWKKSVQSAKNDQGFINALSNMDDAFFALAGKLPLILTDPKVETQIGGFISGAKNGLVIYGPTPEKIRIPEIKIPIGSISLSKSQRRVILETGNKKSGNKFFGGRMFGVGHTMGTKSDSSQWFRQDWHINHGAKNVCHTSPADTYHYHCGP